MGLSEWSRYVTVEGSSAAPRGSRGATTKGTPMLHDDSNWVRAALTGDDSNWVRGAVRGDDSNWVRDAHWRDAHWR
ncbi:hypothetical protein GCM10023201_04920 [Actinomycetospora corticicola]